MRCSRHLDSDQEVNWHLFSSQSTPYTWSNWDLNRRPFSSKAKILQIGSLLHIDIGTACFDYVLHTDRHTGIKLVTRHFYVALNYMTLIEIGVTVTLATPFYPFHYFIAVPQIILFIFFLCMFKL